MSLTEKKDLRSGTPVWMAYRRRIPEARRLTQNVQTDVLVVGAGISGALIAYALASEGHRVAVIDRRGLLEGSTPASTALLLFEIDTPLILLKRTIGAQAAERAWLRSKGALDALYELTRREKIDASMSVHPSVYLGGDILDARGLAKEVHARERIGLPGRYLDRRTSHHLRLVSIRGDCERRQCCRGSASSCVGVFATSPTARRPVVHAARDSGYSGQQTRGMGEDQGRLHHQVSADRAVYRLRVPEDRTDA